MTAAQFSIAFSLEMACIISVCRVVGWAAHRYLLQPQVVVEMIAGVLLGPSVLGWLAPALEAGLFPADSKKVLTVGAQLGVGLYMFLVGLTVDRAGFAKAARTLAACPRRASGLCLTAAARAWRYSVHGAIRIDRGRRHEVRARHRR